MLKQSNFLPSPVVPTTKIKKTGKKRTAPINQGDLMQPEKIKIGNMTQDQIDLLKGGIDAS